MVSLALWLASLAITTAAAQEAHFYGKYSSSKLLVHSVTTEKNCACNGTWDPSAFSQLSKSFGDSLAQSAKEAKNLKLDPVSIGKNAYTLSADFSEDYSFANGSDSTIWSKIISDMLTVANHTQDHSILTGNFIHTVNGTHAITLTVYSDSSCTGEFRPCETGPTTVERRGSPQAGAGPGLDWSDSEAVKAALQLQVHNETSLHKSIMANETLPAMVYLEDKRLLVDTASIQTDVDRNADGKLQGRQEGCFNSYYDAYSVDGTWANWGNWLPISSCLQTGLSQAGGSTSFRWGYSMNYAESISWNPASLLGALSPSFTFQLTESYSNSNSYTCNVPGNSVGQLWFQNLNGYGYAYKQTCHNAGACGITCGGKQGPNYSGAPGNYASQFGCSNGWSHVNCGAYNNWAQYSVWSH